MSITLCLPPAANEPREPVKVPLTEAETTTTLPARHLIDRVAPDPDNPGTLAVWIEVATQRARPVDVRFAIVARDATAPPRSQFLGHVMWQDAAADVYGTYLGVNSEEN
jgi:hypothetical protein